MTVEQLQDYLKDFKPDAKVIIWEWDNPSGGDDNRHCEIGANHAYQQKTQTVQLYRGLPIQ